MTFIGVFHQRIKELFGFMIKMVISEQNLMRSAEDTHKNNFAIIFGIKSKDRLSP